MSNPKIFIVTDDIQTAEKARAYWEENGLNAAIYSPQQWDTGLDNDSFKNGLKTNSRPSQGQGEMARVIPFPPSQKISTMNEVEKQTIETAIGQCRGNLTLAARALGIGRATLYRKVKAYNIDPNASREREKEQKAA